MGYKAQVPGGGKVLSPATENFLPSFSRLLRHFLSPVSLPFVSLLFQAFFSLLPNSHLPKWPWQSLGGARENSLSLCWVLLAVYPTTYFLFSLCALCSLAALSPYPFNDLIKFQRQFSAISPHTLLNFAFSLFLPFFGKYTLV